MTAVPWDSAGRGWKKEAETSEEKEHLRVAPEVPVETGGPPAGLPPPEAPAVQQQQAVPTARSAATSAAQRPRGAATSEKDFQEALGATPGCAACAHYGQ